MEGPLEKYRKKRDPNRTTEPFSAERSVRAEEEETWAGRFVIHQHDATRMHFDLRLEVGAVLESFAIPRGISLDPTEKHLAIHTESHPFEYLHFEDVIPEGNYGAGAMIIWDFGGVRFLETSAEEGIKRGKIDFFLDGLKAKGRFALIATGRRKAKSGLAGTADAKNQWLLIKKADQHSRPGVHLADHLQTSVASGLTVKELGKKEELASALFSRAKNEVGLLKRSRQNAWKANQTGPLIPMICATEGAPHRSKDFLYELKLDGVRVIATKEGDTVQLSYRSGRSCTQNYSDVARSLVHLPAPDLVLDGEIVSFDERGRPHFETLGPRIRAKRPYELVQAEARVPVVYMVFDVLRIGDVDLTDLPIERRKDLLASFIPTLGLIRRLDHIKERGDALFQMCEAQGLEGMVAKRLGSKYQMGPQVSGHWVKIKREDDAEFVVLGYTSERNDKNKLGALLLGSFTDGSFVYRGRVGAGFSTREGDEFLAALTRLTGNDARFKGLPEDLPFTPVKPELVVRIRSHGFSEGGHLRSAVYRGLRPDVEPKLCTVCPNDEWVDAGEAWSNEPPNESRRSRGERRVQLSNQGKIFWPHEGIKKGDLLDYYERVADALLPHLASRPVVLVRYPDGTEGKSFYQWRVPQKTPNWIRTVELHDDERRVGQGGGKAAFLIDDVDSLLHIVNLGCIPIHILASREQSRDDCDFITIDLDIGERPFRDAISIALSLKELLDELGLAGYPKTSGQRGMHILIPLGPDVTFQSGKLLCELLGRVLVGRHSEFSTMQRRVEKREGKLYIDTGQTGRSRTIVAPYSVRAFPGARVSTPLKWEELHLALDPSVFHLHSVPERLLAHGDPMADFLKLRPDLTQVIAKLSSWMKAL